MTWISRAISMYIDSLIGIRLIATRFLVAQPVQVAQWTIPWKMDNVRSIHWIVFLPHSLPVAPSPNFPQIVYESRCDGQSCRSRINWSLNRRTLLSDECLSDPVDICLMDKGQAESKSTKTRETKRKKSNHCWYLLVTSFVNKIGGHWLSLWLVNCHWQRHRR